MFEIGSFRSRVCGSGISRRAFLQGAAVSPFVTALGANHTQGGFGETKARSVLVLWLWGAPSHIDTFDPKPLAPAEFRGPLSTIPTRTPGVRFTELFPKLAARSDRFALIRSMRHSDSDHLKGGTVALTGKPEDGDGLAPNFGSIIARHRGPRDLPNFIAVGRGKLSDVTGPMKGYGGGNWGRTYDPFPVGCSDLGEIDIPALKLLDGLTPDHLGDRRRLLGELDQVQRSLDGNIVSRWETSKQRAYALLTKPEARNALDLSRESEAVRDAYGRTSFGQSCLLGRRLVEAGVPYVQVNWSQFVEAMTPNCDFGWDTHIYNFDLLPDRHGPILDRAFSALLDDMQQRGLLETTLVLVMGEFGRTPRINGQASRDHWPQCYCSIWAGAGVRGGQVIGESDGKGAEPITEPIHPAMVGATVTELAGVDSQARAELRVLPGARVIHELF